METKNEAREIIVETVENFTFVDPGSLFFNAKYQRMIEPGRLKRIYESIKLHGYRNEEVVTITTDRVVVDGQHRATAAIKANVPAIPVTIKKFGSAIDEAKYFMSKNGFNPLLKPIDYWFGRFLAGDPLAIFVHKYEEDKNSACYSKIAIKGKENKKTKFTFPNIIDAYGTIFINGRHWSLSEDQKYTDFAKDKSYDFLRNGLNEFFYFFFDCFGDDKAKNPGAYRNSSIRSFLFFYRALKRNNIVNKVSSKKMQSFVFTSEFHRMPMAGQTYSLISHFNQGRKTQIEYKDINSYLD